MKIEAKAAPVLDSEMDRAAEVLAGVSRVALACHVSPDADAAGSMLGLAGYLARTGVRVECSWGDDPFQVPGWIDRLGGRSHIVEPSAFPEQPDVMVTLDTASPDRLGSLLRSAERARELIVMDHHVTNPGFGTISLIDWKASSTAEVVFRLIERMGGDLPDESAAALYAGVITDTGRFQYEATTPETLRVAAELREHHFDHAGMAQAFFEDSSFSYLKVLGVALERVTLVPEANLVWTYVTRADLVPFGAAMEDSDDLIDVIRMAREADVACVIKQQRDGRFKVSLRSRGGTDVGAIAQSLGGGGHRLAAGYTATGGVQEAIRELVDALPSRGDQ